MSYKLKNILGSPEKFNLQYRIFNAVLLGGIILVIPAVIGNYLLELNPFTYVFPIISMVYLLGVYVYSMKFRNFIVSFYLGYTFLSLIFIPVFWFLNGGSTGGFQYFIFFILTVLALSSKKRELWIFSTTMFIVLITLIITEYKYPHLVVQYPDKQARLIDLLISFPAVFIGLLAIISFIMLLYKNANQEITAQKEEIEKSHKHITDSINYAKRIQEAMLPSNEIFNNNFNEHFVIYLPRDIVSGDFYWAEKYGNKIIYAVADCTGHGVPGAMLSMLGISLLNKITTQNMELKASEVLDNLRMEVKTSLKQIGKNDNETKDGMDIALCIIDKNTGVLQFSGAYNPLYIYRKDELTILKANRQPIGIYIKEKKFINYEFQLQKGDIIYSFSDGFADQFNSEGKKYKIKRFRELIKNIASSKLQKQKAILKNEFETWKSSNQQMDDIVIAGIKF